MDLQRTQCINFGATRVLAAYNKENVIDVLKLNINDKSDIRFAKKLSQTLSKEYKRRNPVKNTEVPRKPKLQKFFDNFLKSHFPYHDQDYFIAIKNGEKILGGFSSSPFLNSTVIEAPAWNTGVAMHMETMLYAALSNIDKNSLYISGINCFKLLEQTMHVKDINNIKTNIQNHYPSVKFDETKVNNVNLEEYFGINDIEEQILG